MDPSRWIPALRWLPAYDRFWLRGDFVAGITLAAYLLPAALGDASLANLPPQAGLYACLFSGLVFWLFCSSRHTAITVTSAISLLVGASLARDRRRGYHPLRRARGRHGHSRRRHCADRVGGASGRNRELHLRERHGRLQMRRGSVSRQHAVAETVRSSRRAWQFLAEHAPLPCHLNETNLASLAIGLAALAALILGKLFLKHKPVALFVVVGGIVASVLARPRCQGRQASG